MEQGSADPDLPGQMAHVVATARQRRDDAQPQRVGQRGQHLDQLVAVGRPARRTTTRHGGSHEKSRPVSWPSFTCQLILTGVRITRGVTGYARPFRYGCLMLRTDRLVLRRWQDIDRGPFAALNADPVVMEHFPAMLTREQSDTMVDVIEAGFDKHGFGLWALEIAETGEFIGFTGLSVVRFDAPFAPAVEVGWRLARPYWGHGYASEAARRSIAYGLDEERLPEIVSFTYVGNLRSRAVMERVGMTRDPADDFDHPRLPIDSRLRPHGLYRTRSPRP